VVTRSPQRRAEPAEDFPGVPVHDSMADLLAAGVDAVTITTPPQTRRELVLGAVAAGVPVSVFHNRRWDADIRTVEKVLRSAELGELWSRESRFELDLAAYLDAGPEGGLLRDLDAHLVDQMVWLLGPVASVYCCTDWVDRPEGRTDAFFTIVMSHRGGVRSTVTASQVNRLEAKEYRIYGSGGSYVSRGTDVQAVAIFAGRRPAIEGPAWGFEAEERWGVLNTADGSRRVPSERGAYQDYYSRFAAALRGEGPFPVPAAEVIDVLAVLDAARASEASGQVVAL